MADSFPEIVPRLTVLGDGTVSQAVATGLDYSDLSPDAMANAQTSIAEFRAEAERILAQQVHADGRTTLGTANIPGATNGGQIFFDDSPDNYRFNADGTIQTAFDPVAVYDDAFRGSNTLISWGDEITPHLAGTGIDINDMSNLSQQDIQVIRNVLDTNLASFDMPNETYQEITNFLDSRTEGFNAATGRLSGSLNRIAGVGGIALGVAELANIAGYYSTDLIPGATDQYLNAVDQLNNADSFFEQYAAVQNLHHSANSLGTLQGLATFHEYANPVLQPVGEVLSYVDPAHYTYGFTSGVIAQTEASGMQSFPNALSELAYDTFHHNDGSDSFVQNYVDVFASVRNTIMGGAQYIYNGVVDHINAGNQAYENGDFSMNANDPSTFDDIGGP